jgi:hypothetical protein
MPPLRKAEGARSIEPAWGPSIFGGFAPSTGSQQIISIHKTQIF